MSFKHHYVKYWSSGMLLSTYNVTILPKAKSLKFSPLNGSKFSPGLFSVQQGFMRVYFTDSLAQLSREILLFTV